MSNSTSGMTRICLSWSLGLWFPLEVGVVYIVLKVDAKEKENRIVDYSNLRLGYPFFTT